MCVSRNEVVVVYTNVQWQVLGRDEINGSPVNAQQTLWLALQPRGLVSSEKLIGF